jgi:hypothetical protein
MYFMIFIAAHHSNMEQHGEWGFAFAKAKGHM